MCHFKVYKSVALKVHSQCCETIPPLSFRHFYHPKRRPHTYWQSLPIPPYSQPWQPLIHEYFTSLRICLFWTLGFPGDSAVENLPAVQKTWARSLGQEDSPGEGNGNNSSILT